MKTLSVITLSGFHCISVSGDIFARGGTIILAGKAKILVMSSLKDRETKREKNRETKRQKYRKTEKIHFSTWLKQQNKTFICAVKGYILSKKTFNG